MKTVFCFEVCGTEGVSLVSLGTYGTRAISFFSLGTYGTTAKHDELSANDEPILCRANDENEEVLESIYRYRYLFKR